MNAEARAALSCTLVALAASALAGCERKVSVEPATIAWGEPVKGLQAGIWIHAPVPGRDRVLPLSVHVRNVGAHPPRILSLLEQQKYCIFHEFEVRVEGRLVKPPVFPTEATGPPPVDAFIRLQPGDANWGEAVLEREHWELEGDCSADVTFIFANSSPVRTASLDGRIAGPTTTVTGLWVGEARSGTVRVTIGRDWSAIIAAGQAVTVLVFIAALIAIRVLRKRETKTRTA